LLCVLRDDLRGTRYGCGAALWAAVVRGCDPRRFLRGRDARDSIEELQADLDSWIAEYNEARHHQGRWCFMQTFLDAMPMTKEKMIAA
jgi:hypothetical protein